MFWGGTVGSPLFGIFSGGIMEFLCDFVVSTSKFVYQSELSEWGKNTGYFIYIITIEIFMIILGGRIRLSSLGSGSLRSYRGDFPGRGGLFLEGNHFYGVIVLVVMCPFSDVSHSFQVY